MEREAVVSSAESNELNVFVVHDAVADEPNSWFQVFLRARKAQAEDV